MPGDYDFWDDITGNDSWIEQRLAETGHPPPRYAREGTVSWMRALAILVGEGVSDEDLTAKYAGVVARRAPVDPALDTAVFASIVMAAQNLLALKAIVDAGSPVSLLRSAIVGWYYGLYFSGSAMVIAQQGTVPNSHAPTAKAWDRAIVQEGLAPSPFNFRLSSLVATQVDTEAQAMRSGSTFSLPHTPTSLEEARGAHVSSLTGTAKHLAEGIKRDLERDLGKLGLVNFRTKQARQIRDERFGRRPVCFLDQAFRYRGKAHYRDVLYLGYNDLDENTRTQFVTDLGLTLQAFMRMAAHFCDRRVERGTWARFHEEVFGNTLLRPISNVLRGTD